MLRARRVTSPEPFILRRVLLADRFSRDAGIEAGPRWPLGNRASIGLAQTLEEQLGRSAMAGLFLTILMAPLPIMLIMAGKELLWHQQPAPIVRKTIPVSVRTRR